jgi:xylan 1,4-beta-xylosidase
MNKLPLSWPTGIEGQRKADLGNGTFLNPIIAGDHPDPTVLKDGDDYYMTFSSFNYVPGLVIWHSRDLVNWRPLGPALQVPIGSVFAPDLVKHDGRYYLYVPALRTDVQPAVTIYVLHASNIAGPWSEPIDMHIHHHVDPGHVVGEDGKRYLFLNDGHRVRLSDNGLAADGEVEKVYDGWPIPPDWVIEGFWLEAPRLAWRNDWLYQFSAQGGTGGPPTGHMVVVARSRSIHGPWENCSHNPIVRTTKREAHWWSRGHATLVEGPCGDDWLVYHAYEKDRHTLGRQVLLEPIAWTEDGWPRALGGDLETPLKVPAGGEAVPHGLALSGDLGYDIFGTRFASFAPEPDWRKRVRIETNALVVQGQGEGPAQSSPLALIAGDPRYEIAVDVELRGNANAGLLLFYDRKLFCGLGGSLDRLHYFRAGVDCLFPHRPSPGKRFQLKIFNDDQLVTLFCRPEGQPWQQHVSLEVSGYNHNVADGFLSLRPALYTCGDGDAVFRNLTYHALDSDPKL